MNIWRDFGIFIVFIIFNYFVVYMATWLRFRGKNSFKGLMSKLTVRLSPSAMPARCIVWRCGFAHAYGGRSSVQNRL